MNSVTRMPPASGCGKISEVDAGRGFCHGLLHSGGTRTVVYRVTVLLDDPSHYLAGADAPGRADQLADGNLAQ